MGVPKFAGWLTKKYPPMIVDACPSNVHGLYIDLNGLIHPCCHDEHDPAIALRPLNEKLRSICLALETLVVTVRPKKVLYIAVDGVAPRAKMNQQRSRRYMNAAVAASNDGSGTATVAAIEREFTTEERAVVEDELADIGHDLLDDLLYGGHAVVAPARPPPAVAVRPLGCGADYDTAESAAEFDSNCISPGTAFMEAVSRTVRNFIAEKMKPACGVSGGNSESSSIWRGASVVFSDASTAGEGEHKAIDFLRLQSSFSGFNSGGYHVIAGLDADLIFLALSLHIPRLIILRDHKRPSYGQMNAAANRRGSRRARENFQEAEAEAETSPMSSSDTTPIPSPSFTPEIDGESKTLQLDTGSSTMDERVIDVTVETGTSEGETAPTFSGIVAEPCNSFEYFDIDVVGASIVSETNLLLEAKGISFPTDGPAVVDAATYTAANGYDFRHVRGETTAALCGKVKVGGKLDGKPKAPLGPFHPCRSSCNSKIIDDFIVLAMLLGNDFLPHLPSAFCGESGMDTIWDVYVSSVLPHGYLTSGNHDIGLIQLQRFLAAYAAVEALKFRQHAIQTGAMTPLQAASLDPCTSLDRRAWRTPYIETTSLRDEAGVQRACQLYVEGLRFVWRYYSSSSKAISWSWYYTFHHAPLAVDLAAFLAAQGPRIQELLLPPALEQHPPLPFVQLLCILPPTSAALMPLAFRKVMKTPPTELKETFPQQWVVDATAAYGKDHLAVVQLPFANMNRLKEEVAAGVDLCSREEQQRNHLQEYHFLFQVCPAGVAKAKAMPPGEEEAKIQSVAFPMGCSAVVLPMKDTGCGLPEAQEKQGDEAPPTVCCFALTEGPAQRPRPRTYSYQVEIPGLSLSTDGRLVQPERRPYRGRAKQRAKEARSKFLKGGDRSGAKEIVGPPTRQAMLFGEFLVCMAAAMILSTALLLACLTPGFAPLQWLGVLVQMTAVSLFGLAIAFGLGLAVMPKGRSRGSGLSRNTIFTAFVDWQCCRCLMLNFSRNQRCFICSAPFDSTRCTAVFSGKTPPCPPLMEPNHNLQCASYQLVQPTK